MKDSLPEIDYIDSLLADLARDIERYQISRPLHSIFIGGGTPSLFSPEAINRLLRGVETQLVFSSGIEITMEANPSTFEFENLPNLKRLGLTVYRLACRVLMIHY